MNTSAPGLAFSVVRPLRALLLIPLLAAAACSAAPSAPQQDPGSQGDQGGQGGHVVDAAAHDTAKADTAGTGGATTTDARVAADLAEGDGPATGPSGAEAGVPDAGALAADAATDADAGLAQTCATFDKGTTSAKISSPDLKEASGLAASRAHPGVLYVHNDSGDSARFFAVKSDGTYLGQFELTGAKAIDWEDMAMGPRGDATWIYLSDAGDNAARAGDSGQRSSIDVYRLAEPALPAAPRFTEKVAGWEKLTFTYPDKPHDSETLMIDPRTGDLFFVTKELDGKSIVFTAAAPLQANKSVVLKAVATLQFGRAPLTGDLLATSGDISPFGDALLIRSYDTAFFWRRPPAQTVTEALAGMPTIVPLIKEEQGESIAFAADASAYFTISEGDAPPLHEFRATCPTR